MSRRQLPPDNPSEAQQSLAVRVAEWVRLVVFLGFWAAAAYRFAHGATFTAGDTASLAVSIGLLPGRHVQAVVRDVLTVLRRPAVPPG